MDAVTVTRDMGTDDSYSAGLLERETENPTVGTFPPTVSSIAFDAVTRGDLIYWGEWSDRDTLVVTRHRVGLRRRFSVHRAGPVSARQRRCDYAPAARRGSHRAVEDGEDPSRAGSSGKPLMVEVVRRLDINQFSVRLTTLRTAFSPVVPGHYASSFESPPRETGTVLSSGSSKASSSVSSLSLCASTV